MTATVLLVDDEPAVGTVLAALLRNEGFNVWLADSIEQGLERVEEAPPDVILCDGHLGYESAQDLIRRLPVEHRIPVLVMSDAEADWTGAVGFLWKPCPAHELFRAVRSAIGVCECAAE